MGISEEMLKGVQVKSINDEVFTNSARYAARATAFVQAQEDTQSPPLTTILLLDFLVSILGAMPFSDPGKHSCS